MSPALPLVAMAALLLCACAQPAPAAPLRVLVQLTTPSTDAAAIERGVAARAGVPAHYLGASGPGWHVLTLDCDLPVACDAALRRLRDDRATYAAVQLDERRRIHTP